MDDPTTCAPTPLPGSTQAKRGSLAWPPRRVAGNRRFGAAAFVIQPIVLADPAARVETIAQPRSNCLLRRSSMKTSRATLIAWMLLAFTAGRGAEAHSQERVSPARVHAITRGPPFHWFGYYDKLQFDPSGRHVLGMQVEFENRNPAPDDVVRIGMVDLEDGDRWIELGESRAWCWQQGCHLQWRPGSDREVIWNDRVDGKFVAVVLDVKSGQRRLLPRPIDNLSPDGRWALGVDFARIRDFRAGYGYAGVTDPYRDVATPETSGVYRMDLDSGESRLLVSCAQSAKVEPQHPTIATGARRYINHVQWSPDGRRFLFLERPSTRLMTAASDGSDLRVVMFDASHYTWRDSRQICVWTGDGYRLYADEPLADGKLLWLAVNGHQTYFPDRDWLLTDTYPDARRMQTLYLFHLPTARRIDLGQLACPPEYRGDWRADLHPRLSPDGRWVCFDSAHQGGRQMYLMDIRGVGPNPPVRDQADKRAHH